MNPIENIGDIDSESYKRIRQSEFVIGKYLGLSGLNHGKVIVQNEKGWRENERFIDYAWMVEIDRSFVGSAGLFFIKFDASKFREHNNREENVSGIYNIGECGIGSIYKENQLDFSQDISFQHLDLLGAGKGSLWMEYIIKLELSQLTSTHLLKSAIQV